MSSWRSKGLNPSRFLAGSLIFFAALSTAGAEEGKKGTSFPVALLGLQVTLAGVTSFQDFREIRAALSQSEGVEKLSLDSEAPGLVTFRVQYTGEPASLIEKLEAFFPKKYSMREKPLPSGYREITISRTGP